MKKGSVIALIVAAVLILTGGVILVLGLSFAGSAEDPVTMLTENEVSITENFDSILIDTEDCNVDIVLFEGAADPHVVLKKRDRTSHSVLVEDGTLKIRMMDNRTWKDFIGVNWESMEMTVYLPKAEYASLRITTATGHIRKVPGNGISPPNNLFPDQFPAAHGADEISHRPFPHSRRLQWFVRPFPPSLPEAPE